jgi:hypothetical protein
VDLTLLLSSAAVLATGITASTLAGRRARAEERRIQEEKQSRREQELQAGRTRLEHKLRQAQEEVERLRRISLLKEGPMTSRERLDASAAREILARLRGLLFLDGVAIAGPEGLSFDQESNRLETDLATTAAVLGSLASSFEALGLPLLGAEVVLQDTLHVSARALPAWTRGAWLVAGSTGQFPNPLAVGAALALAEHLGGAGAPPPAPRLLPVSSGRFGERGAHTRQILDELEQGRRVCRATAAVLTRETAPLLGVHEGGPDAAFCAELLSALVRGRRHLESRLRQPVDQLSLDTPHLRLHLAALGPKLQLLLAGPELAPDPLLLQRFGGKIRRLQADAESPQEAA